MSYCRWSSDNWNCDLYCYADCSGGFTTWIAEMRHKNVPKLPAFGSVPDNEYWKLHDEQMYFLDTAELKPIGLKYDGERFNDPDLVSFLNRVLHLRKVGYNVPEYVIDRIKKEMGDLAVAK